MDDIRKHILDTIQDGGGITLIELAYRTGIEPAPLVSHLNALMISGQVAPWAYTTTEGQARQVRYAEQGRTIMPDEPTTAEDLPPHVPAVHTHAPGRAAAQPTGGRPSRGAAAFAEATRQINARRGGTGGRVKSHRTNLGADHQ